MHFYTPAECAGWAQELSVALDQFGKPVREFIQPFRLHAKFPTEFTRLVTFSRLLDAALQPRQTLLLWVSDFGIYPSNETISCITVGASPTATLACYAMHRGTSASITNGPK
jgi:hypothetical protein